MEDFFELVWILQPADVPAISAALGVVLDVNRLGDKTQANLTSSNHAALAHRLCTSNISHGSLGTRHEHSCHPLTSTKADNFMLVDNRAVIKDDVSGVFPHLGGAEQERYRRARQIQTKNSPKSSVEIHHRFLRHILIHHVVLSLGFVHTEEHCRRILHLWRWLNALKKKEKGEGRKNSACWEMKEEQSGNWGPVVKKRKSRMEKEM